PARSEGPMWYGDNPQLGPHLKRHEPALTGPLRVVTPPAAGALPVDIATVKLHCRIDGADEDPLVERLIRDAWDYLDRNTPGPCQLATATYDLPVRHWWHGPLKLAP